MVKNYVPDAGDVIWIDLDPTKGSEQAGHRPAVVLSPSSYNDPTGLCVCVPCTNSVKGYPYEVGLSGQNTGVALADQVKNLAWRTRKAKKKSKVTPQELATIRAKLKTLIL